MKERTKERRKEREERRNGTERKGKTGIINKKQASRGRDGEKRREEMRWAENACQKDSRQETRELSA